MAVYFDTSNSIRHLIALSKSLKQHPMVPNNVTFLILLRYFNLVCLPDCNQPLGCIWDGAQGWVCSAVLSLAALRTTDSLGDEPRSYTYEMATETRL